MPRMIPLAALVAVPLALAAGPGHAQIASYCTNHLAATSFFSVTASRTLSTATLSHFVTLQNPTASPVSYTVKFTAPNARVTSLQPGGTPAFLHPHQSVQIILAQEVVSNPSGSGGLSPTDTATGLPHYTAVTCMGLMSAPNR